MNDAELKDKLAFQYSIQFEDNVAAEQDFKAGWDAARANEHKIILKPETGGTYTVHAKITTTAEVERDQLREAAEKLAEALEFMTMPITGDQLTIESLLETITNDDERGRQALAAYRKQFPKATK